MVERTPTASRGAISGRGIAAAIVLLGAVMGLLGLLLREGRKPGLPLKPGSIVIVTSEAAVNIAADADTTRFDFAIAPSSELVANLGSIATGRMPREHGCVRAGEALRAKVPTLAEVVAGQGFATAAFLQLSAPAELQAGALLRGISEVTKNGTSDREVLTQTAGWLEERGTSPSFVWVHLKGDPAAIEEFLTRLRNDGVAARAAIVIAAGLSGGDRVALELRLPVALLSNRVDSRPVALIDIAPTVCELFAVRAGDLFGPPFLLAPRWRGPRFVLATRPLTGAYADADEVRLFATGIAYTNAPVSGPIEQVDAATRNVPPEALTAELRATISERFGYRFDEVDLADLLRSVGSEARAPPGTPARVFVARHVKDGR